MLGGDSHEPTLEAVGALPTRPEYLYVKQSIPTSGVALAPAPDKHSARLKVEVLGELDRKPRALIPQEKPME